LVFAMGDALWQGGLAPGQPPQRIREGAFCVHYWAPLWVDHDEIYFADYVSTRGSFDVFTTLRHFRSATPDVVVETPVVVGDSDTTVGFAPPYVYQLSNSSLAQADLRDGALGGLASPPSNDSFLQSAAISGAWAYWTETHRRGTDSYLTLRRAALAEADLTQPLVDLDDGVPRIAVLRDRVYVTTGPESAEVLYELLLPPAPCSHLQPCADGQTCSADALCHP